MKRSTSELPSRLAIDASVIMSHLFGEALGELARRVFRDGVRKLYIPHNAMAEAYYQLCRKNGPEYADGAISSFMDGTFAEAVSSEELDLAAGRYKCERSIALADCYVLTAAKVDQASALFARREEDLRREIKARSFDIQILFLNEIASQPG